MYFVLFGFILFIVLFVVMFIAVIWKSQSHGQKVTSAITSAAIAALESQRTTDKLSVAMQRAGDIAGREGVNGSSLIQEGPTPTDALTAATVPAVADASIVAVVPAAPAAPSKRVHVVEGKSCWSEADMPILDTPAYARSQSPALKLIQDFHKPEEAAKRKARSTAARNRRQVKKSADDADARSLLEAMEGHHVEHPEQYVTA